MNVPSRQRKVFRSMGYAFTAEMEARLDPIAGGREDYARIATEIDTDLEASLPRIRSNLGRS